METKVRNVGNSLGFVFPKETGISKDEVYKIIRIDDGFALIKDKGNIYDSDSGWEDYDKTQEEKEWDEMEMVGREY